MITAVKEEELITLLIKEHRGLGAQHSFLQKTKSLPLKQSTSPGMAKEEKRKQSQLNSLPATLMRAPFSQPALMTKKRHRRRRLLMSEGLSPSQTCSRVFPMSVWGGGGEKVTDTNEGVNTCRLSRWGFLVSKKRARSRQYQPPLYSSGLVELFAQACLCYTAICGSQHTCNGSRVVWPAGLRE